MIQLKNAESITEKLDRIESMLVKLNEMFDELRIKQKNIKEEIEVTRIEISRSLQ